ncbi:phosphodiesterase [Roseobacter denitrificans]|uniref:Putative glycerophosphoryl diester phosphodiesterase n=1 Tax=Roseobacter denitrificans (strain ATCC 33942 / OCh 114) TaxID=375451 RepID=Q16BN3_ROSDO|nr:glycerophosphodiester phosphodiesterase family protein [Roseobacter denitrificans]ABG30610.1 putative glycerophosphoryl diester phosphodiesterase [Roseobacter denitrificans OCh 114]AVL53745.1 phosphodiesterase [Roseobacter denitrificans]SFG19499.1 Glycerophosphoryl diester phosphodiesterase [Roseobacter denitrificans OCh 114]
MIPHLPEAFLTRPLAHRALHDIAQGRPENSRAAIKAAIAAGYGIEIDIQLSADDQAMVFHDYNLARLTTAEGRVRDTSAADLQKTQLRAGAEGIPGLPEILDLVAGQVPLLIEIKDQDGAMGLEIGPLEASVARALQGYVGPVALMSFNPHSVLRLAELVPDVPRGLVTCAYEPSVHLGASVCDVLRGIPDYDRAACSFISHQKEDLRRARVADLKADGARILCWTVRSPQEEAHARQIADNITFEKYLAPIAA